MRFEVGDLLSVRYVDGGVVVADRLGLELLSDMRHCSDDELFEYWKVFGENAINPDYLAGNRGRYNRLVENYFDYGDTYGLVDFMRERGALVTRFSDREIQQGSLHQVLNRIEQDNIDNDVASRATGGSIPKTERLSRVNQGGVGEKLQHIVIATNNDSSICVLDDTSMPIGGDSSDESVKEAIKVFGLESLISPECKREKDNILSGMNEHEKVALVKQHSVGAIQYKDMERLSSEQKNKLVQCFSNQENLPQNVRNGECNNHTNGFDNFLRNIGATRGRSSDSSLGKRQRSSLHRSMFELNSNRSQRFEPLSPLELGSGRFLNSFIQQSPRSYYNTTSSFRMPSLLPVYSLPNRSYFGDSSFHSRFSTERHSSQYLTAMSLLHRSPRVESRYLSSFISKVTERGNSLSRIGYFLNSLTC